MRHALAALPAILLLATPLPAQEAEPAFDNVYVDVEGAAVQIPVALAAEACGRDEETLRADVLRLLEETGTDPSVVAAAPADGAADPAQAVTGVEATAAETGTTPSDTGTEAPSAVAGTEVASAETNETVTTGQGTADPSTSEPGSELLALAVCQVDLQTAARLGIPQANEIVTD